MTTQSDGSGDARSTTQRTLDMLKAEWQREERERILSHVVSEARKHEFSDRIDAEDKAYGGGYVQALDDLTEWLSA